MKQDTKTRLYIIVFLLLLMSFFAMLLINQSKINDLKQEIEWKQKNLE